MSINLTPKTTHFSTLYNAHSLPHQNVPKLPKRKITKIGNLVLLYDSSNTTVPALFHNIVITVLKLQLKMLVFSKKPQNVFLK